MAINFWGAFGGHIRFTKVFKSSIYRCRNIRPFGLRFGLQPAAAKFLWIMPAIGYASGDQRRRSRLGLEWQPFGADRRGVRIYLSAAPYPPPAI